MPRDRRLPLSARRRAQIAHAHQAATEKTLPLQPRSAWAAGCMRGHFLLFPKKKTYERFGTNQSGCGRHGLRGLEHSLPPGTAPPRGSGGCGGGESDENQPAHLAHTGRLHREISGRKGARPARHARRTGCLCRRRLCGDSRAYQLRLHTQLLRHLARGGGD